MRGAFVLSQMQHDIDAAVWGCRFRLSFPVSTADARGQPHLVLIESANGSVIISYLVSDSRVDKNIP